MQVLSFLERGTNRYFKLLVNSVWRRFVFPIK